MARHTKSFALGFAVLALSTLAACQEAGEAGGSSEVAEAPADAEDLVDVGAHMQLSASAALREAMEDTFDEGQVTLLESVAHQMVVAKHCDGFELDAEKAKVEMEKLGTAKEGTTIDADALKQKKSMALGMALGSQLTIAANDPEGLCSHADEEKPGEGETADGYILTSAT